MCALLLYASLLASQLYRARLKLLNLLINALNRSIVQQSISVTKTLVSCRIFITSSSVAYDVGALGGNGGGTGEADPGLEPDMVYTMSSNPHLK